MADVLGLDQTSVLCKSSFEDETECLVLDIIHCKRPVKAAITSPFAITCIITYSKSAVWEAYKYEMEFPLCLRGPDERVIHDFQSTLFVAGTLRASVRTDGLLGSMLCHAEPLQEPLALI